MTARPNPAPATGPIHSIIELVKTVILAVVIAVVVRTVAFEPFTIPSGSMIPTLLVGDYLFVSKYAYGYSRYSLPFGLPVISGRLLGRMPERGDVVVFKLPLDNRTDYIKRVIGLPGDRIQILSGVLHINGEPVKRERLDDVTLEPGSFGVFSPRVTRYRETLPNGRSHDIIEISDNAPFDNTDVYVVPEGHIFALGDNRDSSRDSRFLSEVGYIPVINLVGRAEFIFLSIERSPFAVWLWPETLRWDRLVQNIE